jgi:micrococcal nuclease
MYEYPCKIIKVIDGDTVDVDIDLGFGIWLKKQRIRLYGIDTPESRTSDDEEKVYGLIAKGFVQNHLPLGSLHTLRTRKDGKGKYGRILGEFIYNYDYDGVEIKSTVNEELIKTHNAVRYFGQSKDDIAAEHLENRELLK